MRKKTFFLVSSLVAALAIGVATFSMKKSFFVAKGQAETYAFTLNAANSPATYGNNVEVEATALGNSLKFNYVGASSSAGNHMALADGGYIQNVDKLMDLVSLSVAGTGTFKLHTGFEGYENVKTFTIADALEATTLSNVSYFKLEAVGAATVNSITGEYNCQETPGKDLIPGVAGTSPMFDVVCWNRLVHDVDTTNDFEFVVTYQQETDEVERLKRPAFLVYPAEYDENDVIPHTDSSHFFDGTGGYLRMRQSSSVSCMSTHYNSEKDIGAADSWLGTNVSAELDGQFGGSDTKQARITRACHLTLTFKLENHYEEGTNKRYQVFKFTQDCNSYAKISGTDYTGFYTKTYTFTSAEGNIFPCDRIGLAIGHNYEGLYRIESASSTGVR